MRDYSYNGEAYVDFLRQCKQLWKSSKPMIIFQDNLRAHKSGIAKEAFAELNIKPVWNVAYSPEYNSGIERFWGQVKTRFRPKLLGYMLNA